MSASHKTAARTERSLRVLVSKDDEVNEALAATLLARQGRHAGVAGSGREALAACERGGFDLIPTDVQMPRMDAHLGCEIERLHAALAAVAPDRSR